MEATEAKAARKDKEATEEPYKALRGLIKPLKPLEARRNQGS